MIFQTPHDLSTYFFIAILIFVVGAFLSGVYFSQKNLTASPLKTTILTGVATSIWLIIFSLVVKFVLKTDEPMPGIPILLAFIFVVTISYSLSRFGKQLAYALPLSSFIFFQIFRLPLELVLHNWYEQGSIPETMTWSGQNLDIVSGIVALIVFCFMRKNRKAIWVANITGSMLLINVIRVAVMSAPLPFSWKLETPLLVIFHLPYAFIAPICVGGALVGHILLTRALVSTKK